MRHRVVLTKKAEKEVDRIDKIYQPKILKAIKVLEFQTYSGKKLSGKYKGLYSYRVWPYRIIYEIYPTKLIVYIITIGHRQGVY